MMKLSSLVLRVVVLCLAVSCAACSAGEDLPPQYDAALKGLGGSFGLEGVASGPCEDGAERRCSMTYHQANGATSCFAGVQECIDGEWGDCHEAAEVEKSSAFRPAMNRVVVAGLNPISSAYVASDSSCDTACDPGCRKFEGDTITVEVDDTGTGMCSPPVCEHSTCDIGSRLDASCDTCVADVCATPGYESCCDASGIWSAACVSMIKRKCSPDPWVSEPSLEHRCDYALLGSGALAIYGGSVYGGPIGGGTGSNQVTSLWGSTPEIAGGIYSQGSLAIYDSIVDLAAKAGGAISCTSVSGSASCIGSTAVPNASVPTKSFNCNGGAVTVSSNGSYAPGDHGAVTVAAGVTLTLDAGPHYMSSLTLNAGAKIALPASGEVHLNVCGNVSFGADSRVIASSPSDALRFQIYGKANLTIGARAIVYGIYSFPTGSLTMATGSAASKTILYGAAHVSTGTMNPFSVIDASGVTGGACRALVLDEPSSCPALSPPTASCGSTPPEAVTQSFIFEPQCASHESAVWGLLSWNSVLPDDAQIGFAARVAKDETALASESLVEIARAKNDAVSPTVDCDPFSTVSGCPIDLTSALGLPNRGHPQVLEITVTMEPDGMSVPELSEWEVMYSCQDDQ